LKVKITRSALGGTLTAPPSKSYTHRALICSALAHGSSRIHRPLCSDDTEATQRILRELGVDLSTAHAPWQIEGGELLRPRSELFCGESGTTMRFMAAVCGLIDGESKLIGGPSLSQRPIGPLLDGLRQLGVDCSSVNGYPPITVKGKGRIRGGDVAVRGDISSQFVSAILLIAPLTDEGVSMKLTTPLESKPYVSMTMDIQRRFAVQVDRSEDMREFHVEKQSYSPTDYRVEGDWSSAAYPLGAGALAGQVTVEGLNMESLQADASIVSILHKMGVIMKLRNDAISVSESRLAGVDHDMSDCPDLFPIVSALCASAEGESVLKGVERLRYKESDRSTTMVDGLRGMGIQATEHGQQVIIVGGNPKGCFIDSRNDHRIAMAFAVLAMAAEGETTILNAECVSKSYPEFWEDMESLGAQLRRSNSE